MNMNDPIASLLGGWSTELNLYSVLLRVAVSVVFAAIIGCERASKRHAAGQRTFILVSLASTVAMMLDKSFAGMSTPLISAAAVIAIAIISSNRFSAQNQIKGLTTSVALWACGVIGLTIGAGLYTVSVIGYAALMCCLALFPTLKSTSKPLNHFEVHLELKNREDLQRFITTMRTLGLKIDDIEANPAYINSGLSVYSVSLTVRQKDRTKYSSHKEMIEAINTLDFVYYAEEID
ncbi:MAG: MgtC/SapB family protein [Christensenellales bacterium]